MQFITQKAIAASLILCAAWPAAAWGPRTQSTIVTTAVQVYSKGQNVPLYAKLKEVQQGAGLQMQELEALYPGVSSNPLSAIDSEMALLQAVKSNTLDSYYSYRLGALAALVAEMIAPMREADAVDRSQYYSDVDRQIEGSFTLKPAPRQLVDPAVYFPEQMALAQYNDELIEQDYKSGQGFGGIAQALLPEDASRSINAIADVWNTVLSGPSVQASVSVQQKRTYVLNAFDFYSKRGNAAEIDAASERLAKITEQTPDMQVQIGDMLYDAGLYERAIARYNAVRLQDPNRRDVVEKISDYYVAKGNEALEENRLENALEAFVEALDANPLHPTAEAERLKVARLIQERDERQAADQELFDRGTQFMEMASQEAQRGRSAEAIVLLRQAEESFQNVSPEFPLVYHKAMRALEDSRSQMEKSKQSLTMSAKSFSGSGFALDAQAMARAEAKNVDKEALEAMTKIGYAAELRALEQNLQGALKLAPNAP